MFLYISDRKKLALQAIDLLSTLGYAVLHTPLETAAFFCREKDTGGVLIDCVPDLAKGEALCRLLRDRYPDMPIAAIVGETQSPALPADTVIRGADSAKELCTAAIDFFSTVCRFSPRPLTCYYLSVDHIEPQAVWMGYPFKLTPREHRILYCLLYHAPKALMPDDLIALCSPTRPISLASLRAQIGRINRRAADVAPTAPPLISHRRAVGFFITPSILSADRP